MKKIMLLLVLVSSYMFASGGSTVNPPKGYIYSETETPVKTLENINDLSGENPKQILMIQSNLPWNSHANTEVMNELGYGYDEKKWSEISLDIMKQYPIVLIVNDQNQKFYDDYATNKDDIESWIKAGGTLMFFSASDGWADGRLNANLPGDVTYTYGYYYYNKINEVSTDYISFTGLSDSVLYSNYASHGFYDDLTTLQNNSNIQNPQVHLLTDPDSHPTAISYKMGEGYVFASTLTWEHAWVHYSGEPKVEGNVGPFSRNALGRTFQFVVNHASQGKIPPHVLLTANTYSGPIGTKITFTANAYDEDGYIVKYMWDFDGDGTFDKNTTTNTAEYTYQSAGDYEPKVKAIDNHDLFGQSSVEIFINNTLPIVMIEHSMVQSCKDNNATYEFTISVSGNYTGNFEWDFESDGVIDEVTTQDQHTVQHTYTFSGEHTYKVYYSGEVVYRNTLNYSCNTDITPIIMYLLN